MCTLRGGGGGGEAAAGGTDSGAAFGVDVSRLFFTGTEQALGQGMPDIPAASSIDTNVVPSCLELPWHPMTWRAISAGPSGPCGAAEFIQ